MGGPQQLNADQSSDGGEAQVPEKFDSNINIIVGEEWLGTQASQTAVPTIHSHVTFSMAWGMVTHRGGSLPAQENS